MQIERGLEQQRRQDQLEDDIVRQREAHVERRECDPEARQDETDSVGKSEPPRDDRYRHSDAKQGYCSL